MAPKVTTLIAAFILTAAANLIAQQETPPVAPGDRVRVSAPTIALQPLVGTVVSMGADTCVLAVEGRVEPLTLPLASLTRLEVGDQKSKAVTGAVLGGLVGGVAGLVTTYAICYMECNPEEERDTRLRLTLGGAAVGTGIGVIIGSFVKSDRWEEVPLDQLRVTIAPQYRGGLAVSASVRI